MSEMKNSTRYNNFNAIKFVAACFIIVGHMYVLLGQAPMTIFQNSVHTIGIQIFFIVGGYFAYLSFKRDPNLIRYFLRRILRLLPPLIGMVCVLVFIVGPLFTTIGLKSYFLNGQTWAYFKNILLNIQFFLPGVFADNIYPSAINGSLWSLTFEVMFFLLLPFLAWCLQRFKKHQYTLLSILIVISWIVKMIKNIYYPQSVLLFYNQNVLDLYQLLPYFLLGMLFTSERFQRICNLQISLFPIFILLAIQLPYPVLDFFYTFALTYFIFSFALSPNPRFATTFKKTDFAYGLYLYGFVVQQILIHLFKDRSQNYLFYLVLSIIISFFLAYLSWYFIELKSEKWTQKLLENPILKHKSIEKLTMKNIV